jgi:hypothetical protein
MPQSTSASADSEADAEEESTLSAEVDDTTDDTPAPESAPIHAVEPPAPATAAPSAATPQVEEVAADDMTATESPAEAPAPEAARPAPRGRFERFYAPGQGMRAERNGNGHTAATGATEPQRPAREPFVAHAVPTTLHAPPTPPTPHADSDEDGATPTPSEPREDVRGHVGGLIDALHDLFAHDRTIASQGGTSRCGLCYFHFPVSALSYREAEGFYVCVSCGQALGAARVSMVRRQQRL